MSRRRGSWRLRSPEIFSNYTHLRSRPGLLERGRVTKFGGRRNFSKKTKRIPRHATTLKINSKDWVPKNRFRINYLYDLLLYIQSRGNIWRTVGEQSERLSQRDDKYIERNSLPVSSCPCFEVQLAKRFRVWLNGLAEKAARKWSTDRETDGEREKKRGETEHTRAKGRVKVS